MGEEAGEGVGIEWRVRLASAFHCDEVDQNWNDEGGNGVDIPPLIAPDDRHLEFM